MSPEKLPTSPEVSNSLTPLATTEAQKLQESFRVSITKERNLTTYLGYLTALQQLPGASLDALFDGEVELGEEELFTVYGIISMFNGNNSFTHNKPPKKISYDRNWALDSTFDLQYETLSDKNTGKSVSYIKSIGGSTSLIPSAFGDTQLVFVYDSTTRQLKGMEFKKPIQRVNESIIPHRNGAWLVERIDIGNALKVDNSIQIVYQNGLPVKAIQSKYGVLGDEMEFMYDTKNQLSQIVYRPAISVRSVQSLAKSKSLWDLKDRIFDILMGNVKRSKDVDSTRISPEHTGTDIHLWASRWYYTDGKTQFEWKDGVLTKMKMTQTGLIDDQKELTISP